MLELKQTARQDLSHLLGQLDHFIAHFLMKKFYGIRVMGAAWFSPNTRRIKDSSTE
jgi:hypothetical protein